jgi:uncharacterized protein (TIGR00369 family)
MPPIEHGRRLAAEATTIPAAGLSPPMGQPRTHTAASEQYVGRPVRVEDGAATAELETDEEMAVDETGLVHGGFAFSLADYAAMLAVNEPTVVLTDADVSFPAPVVAGERLLATATVEERDGRRATVTCSVTKVDETAVLEGTFDCYVPEAHVLDRDA